MHKIKNKVLAKLKSALPNIIDIVYGFAITLAEIYGILLIFIGIFLFAVLYPDKSMYLKKVFDTISIDYMKDIISNGTFVRVILLLFFVFKILSLIVDLAITGIHKVHVINFISILCCNVILYYRPVISIDEIIIYFGLFIIIKFSFLQITDHFIINTIYFKHFDNKEVKIKGYAHADNEKEKEWYTRIQNIKRCHEAGHAVAAELLGINVMEISIENMGNTGGRVTLDIPPILTPSELKKLVMINYSGFLAEKLIINEVTTGCMGADNADLESANRYIKYYILLTDTNISLTGYEDDYIKRKSIEFSIKWLEETKILLENNMEKLKDTLEKIC